MAILSINTNTTGLIGETVNPRRVTMVTTDSLSTITTAGYLNNYNQTGFTILPTDVIEAIYAENITTHVGLLGFFQPIFTYSNGTTSIQLQTWVNPGDVLLPVVSGNLASFNGTTGQIQDSTVAVSAVQLKANIKAAQSANIGGAGAGPIDISVTGATASSVAVVTGLSSSNAVSVLRVLPGSGKISVTFTGDPGASAIINYVVFIAPQ